MNIGVDISQTAFKGTGVARYTTNLVKSLMTYYPKNIYTFLFTSLRQSVPHEIVTSIKPPHTLRTYSLPPTLTSFMWNTVHRYSVEHLIGTQDIFISSDWTQPPTRSAKKVTIVHDLIPYIFPETSTTHTSISLQKAQVMPNIVDTHKRRLEWVKKECDMIITDSESTQNDLIRILGIKKEKITVVYPSVNVPKVSQKEIIRVKKKYNLLKPYVLTVGKIEPRKNIARLIKGFEHAGLHSDMQLAIVGAQGWGNHDFDTNTLGDALSFLGYVPEKDLYPLYAGATIFAMPSLYEGFGYPVIEAMALGTPVCASHTSSLGELVKEYGDTFDPESIESIAASLKKCAQKKPNTDKAKKYAESFTDKQFAREFMSVLESL